MSENLTPPFGGKKLFSVVVENDIVVLAADRAEAEKIARGIMPRHSDELDWHEATYGASQTSNYLPPGWGDSLPYGDEDQYTCKQILEAWEEYERNRQPTKAELEALGQQRLV